MAWAPRDMNSPEWVFDGLAQFRGECKERGVTVVALTHTRRPTGDGQSPVGPIGTSYQENQADSQIIVSRLKGPSAGIHMTMTKSRRAFWIQQGAHVDLQFTATLGYQPVGSALTRWPLDWSAAAMLPEATDTQFRIEQVFRQNGGTQLTTKTIADALGLTERTVRGHCSELEKRGLIQRIGGGPSSAWKWIQR